MLRLKAKSLNELIAPGGHEVRPYGGVNIMSIWDALFFSFS